MVSSLVPKFFPIDLLVKTKHQGTERYWEKKKKRRENKLWLFWSPMILWSIFSPFLERSYCEFVPFFLWMQVHTMWLVLNLLLKPKKSLYLYVRVFISECGGVWDQSLSNQIEWIEGKNQILTFSEKKITKVFVW